MNGDRPDPSKRINREIERSWLRARNGLRYFAGENFSHSGTTPRDVIWSSRKAKLWRYRPVVEQRFRTPVLIYIGLVSRSYVLDLYPNNSFVAELLRAGLDLYLLDWGVPDEADSESDLAVYAHELLPRAIKKATQVAGSTELNVIAYCMGGCITLALLGTRSCPAVRSLVLMATPVDFTGMGEFYEPLRTRRFDVERMIDDTGNVPPNIIYNTVRVRRPTGDLTQYANLWENLWSEDFLEGYQAMRTWIADHVPFPGAAFREVVDQWLINNGFVEGIMTVGGDRVDLSRITIPVMSLVAEHDEMIPGAASAPLPQLLPNASTRVTSIKAGHASLVCGGAMKKRVLPPLLDWFSENDMPADDNRTRIP